MNQKWLAVTTEPGHGCTRGKGPAWSQQGHKLLLTHRDRPFLVTEQEGLGTLIYGTFWKPFCESFLDDAVNQKTRQSCTNFTFYNF